MSNKVRVVTPTYCTEDNERLPLLLQSIYWVSRQTHQNLIHVVVDDGSTDQTPELLDKIAQHNSNLRVYHQENGGSSSAVNFGVENTLSEGDFRYITITHSDDVLPPKSIEDRVTTIEQENTRFIYSDMVVFNEENQPTGVKMAREFSTPQKLYESLRSHKGIPYATMLWDRTLFTEQVQGYDPEITSSEDWDIALRSAQEMSRLGDSHSTIHRVTAAYRVHQNNLGQSNMRDGTKWRCYKRILRKHLRGKDYQIALARESGRFLREWLPEPIKVPLKILRDQILSKPPTMLPFRNEFIESLTEVDYKNHLLQCN
jgi:glycosyltransferase involved in cell wall biosynthesis